MSLNILFAASLVHRASLCSNHDPGDINVGRSFISKFPLDELLVTGL